MILLIDTMTLLYTQPNILEILQKLRSCEMMMVLIKGRRS